MNKYTRSSKWTCAYWKNDCFDNTCYILPKTDNSPPLKKKKTNAVQSNSSRICSVKTKNNGVIDYIIPRRDYFVSIELSLRYFRTVDSSSSSTLGRRKRCVDISLIHRCMYACASAYAWKATRRRERAGPYTEYSRNISRWKKSRIIPRQNSAEKGKRRHDSTHGRVPKAPGIFSSWSQPRGSLFPIKDIPCTRYVLHIPTYPCANDSAAAYFFTRSDRFDVFVIDAPPLTLRENRINQRRRAAWKRAGTAAPTLLLLR